MRIEPPTLPPARLRKNNQKLCVMPPMDEKEIRPCFSTKITCSERREKYIPSFPVGSRTDDRMEETHKDIAHHNLHCTRALMLTDPSIGQL